MNQGDIVKIKNRSGIITLNVGDEIPIETASVKGLGAFKNCRFEFHQKGYGEFIVTLYDQNGDNNLDFILAELNMYGDVKVFNASAESEEVEENIFETIREKT